MTTTNYALMINIKLTCYYSLLVATDSNWREVKTMYVYYRTVLINYLG
jgi:hypothetical protein